MDVTSVIKDYGKFQRNVYLFCLFRGIPNGLHLPLYNFFLPTVEYWCARPKSFAGNLTSYQWKAMLVPGPESTIDGDSLAFGSGRCWTSELETSGDGTLTFGNATVRCDRWEYGSSFYRGSMVQEWDLVCEKLWTRGLFHTAAMIGMLAGTLVSSLGDRLGRRPMVIAGYVSSFVGSVCMAVAPSFALALLCRAILGLGLGLAMTSSFCLLMEVIGPQKRTTTAVAFSLGFTLGVVLLPGFAWFLQEWRTLQGVISVPLLAFVIWAWYLPESPRWLIAVGKMSAARKVILKACSDNRVPIHNIDSVLEQLRNKILQHEEEEAKNKASCLELVRSRRMFLYTGILVYAAAASGVTFDGLQMSVVNLGGDPYLSFLIASLAEFPVAVLCYVGIRWCRRRRFMLVLFGIIGTCACGVSVMPPAWVALRQTLAIAGKMLASGCLVLVWIYAAEVFPTMYRTAGLGACFVGTRIGCSTSPFLLQLGTIYTDFVPLMILAVIGALASLLLLLLPETFRTALPDTIHDSKQLKSKVK
ncbi:hypothetical protein MRX96_018093 [Rhipicephalus microplus]